MEVGERKINISPSVICMDFLDLRNQINVLNSLADSFHFDLIDNHFAPWFGLPIELLVSFKKAANIPIDVHMMVNSVETTIEKLIPYKPEVLTVHIEAITANAFRVIDKIKSAEIKVGVVINPITPLEYLNYILPLVDKVTIMTFDPGMAGQKFVEVTLSKISTLARLKSENGFCFDIEVDGSCNEKNFHRMYNAGANQFVVGTSGLFNLDKNILTAWGEMKKYMCLE